MSQSRLLLASGLSGGLSSSSLTSSGLGGILLGGSLDDTDGDGLTHITNGETTEGRVDREGLAAHGLGGFEADHTGITLLQEGGLGFGFLTGTLIDLGEELGELAGNVGSVAIQDGGITILDLTGVVQDDDLGGEVLDTDGRVVLGVGGDETTLDILDGQVLDVETDVVTGVGLRDLLVVHLDRLNFRRDLGGGEDDVHTGLQDTSLDTTDGDGTDTTNLVDILKGKTEGLVRRTLGDLQVVQGFEESGALVPGGVGGGLHHVVTVPARDGDEGDVLDLVTSTLQEVGDFLLDFVVTSLGEVDRLVVHLVDSDDHLTDTQGESQEGVFLSLTTSGDTSFELTSTRSDDQDGNIGLRGSSNHVLDEITVTRGVNDGKHELVGLELPEGNVDGDTTLTLGLELVQNPGILERTLSGFVGFLLELLNSTLIDTTALVDQMTSSGRLSGIDVTNHDDVDVGLLLLGHGFYFRREFPSHPIITIQFKSHIPITFINSNKSSIETIPPYQPSNAKKRAARQDNTHRHTSGCANLPGTLVVIPL